MKVSKTPRPRPYHVVFSDNDGPWLATYKSYSHYKQEGLFPSNNGHVEIFYKGHSMAMAERWLNRAISLTGE